MGVAHATKFRVTLDPAPSLWLGRYIQELSALCSPVVLGWTIEVTRSSHSRFNFLRTSIIRHITVGAFSKRPAPGCPSQLELNRPAFC